MSTLSNHKFKDTSTPSISQIFPTGSGPQDYREYLVPNFQRNFSWDKTKALQLWQDILEQAKEYEENTSDPTAGQYLLGPTVLLYNDPNKNELWDTKQIIDGQQRFATLTIIFCIIRDIIAELYAGNTSASPIPLDKVKNTIGNYDNTNWKSWKLKLNEVDATFFEEIQKFEDNGSVISHVDKVDNIKAALVSDPPASLEKLTQVYNTLYETIQTGLLVNFEENTASKKAKKKFDEQVEKQLDADLKANPGILGLEPSFWDTIKKWEEQTFGTQYYDDTTSSWQTKSSQDEKTALEAEWKSKTHTVTDPKTGNKNKERIYSDFNDFMVYKINRYKLGQPKNDKTRGSHAGTNYKSERSKELEKRKTDQSKSARQNGMDRLAKIFANLTDNNFLVRVGVKEDDDAFQIFETLNERGQELSKSNLIKTHILKRIKQNDNQVAQSVLDSLLKTTTTDWDVIFNETITKQGDDTFLRESLRSRPPYDTFPMSSGGSGGASKNNLYKIIKMKVKTTDNASDYVKEIKEDSEFSTKLNNPTNYSTHQRCTERRAILGLHALNAQYIRIPILTAQRKWAPDLEADEHSKPDIKEYRNLVRFLVPFFFRYKTIRDQSQQKLEGYMITLSKEIDKGEKTDELIKYLLQLDSDEDFISELDARTKGGNRQFDDPTARHVLYEINYHMSMQTNPYSDKEPYKDITLEHILPKEPKKWDKNKFFKDYKTQSSRQEPHTPEMWTKFQQNLGNLTILKPNINTKISNEIFPIKKNHTDDSGALDGYMSSDLDINEILKAPGTMDWTALDVENREDIFKELAENIWALPWIECSVHNDKKSLKDIKEVCTGEFVDIKDMKCPIQVSGTACGKVLKLKYPPDW